VSKKVSFEWNAERKIAWHFFVRGIKFSEELNNQVDFDMADFEFKETWDKYHSDETLRSGDV